MYVVEVLPVFCVGFDFGIVGGLFLLVINSLIFLSVPVAVLILVKKVLTKYEARLGKIVTMITLILIGLLLLAMLEMFLPFGGAVFNPENINNYCDGFLRIIK